MIHNLNIVHRNLEYLNRTGYPQPFKKGKKYNIYIYTYDHPLELGFRIFSQANMLMEILYRDITYRTFSETTNRIDIWFQDMFQSHPMESEISHEDIMEYHGLAMNIFGDCHGDMLI